MKLGDSVIVRLGKHRGKAYKSGYLPMGMLRDGTETLIRARSNGTSTWASLTRCPYYYPLGLLVLTNSKIKLLNAIKDFR